VGSRRGPWRERSEGFCALAKGSQQQVYAGVLVLVAVCGLLSFKAISPESTAGASDETSNTMSAPAFMATTEPLEGGGTRIKMQRVNRRALMAVSFEEVA